MEPIEAQIREIISEEIPELTDGEITENADLVRDLGADSLDMERICCEVEIRFEVAISDEAQAKVKTVGDVVNLVRELTAGQR